MRSPEIDSFQAGYLLIEPGYRVLKSWKKIGGPLFDQKIFGKISEQVLKPQALENLKTLKLKCIIPIPQSFERSWILGRSPATRISQWLSKELKIPIKKALSLPAALNRRNKEDRQAERGITERLSHSIQYEICRNELPDRGQGAILVDDFMTTGHTLRQAASTLRQKGGLGRIDVFCLGIRPRLIKDGSHLNRQSETDLSKST